MKVSAFFIGLILIMFCCPVLAEESLTKPTVDNNAQKPDSYWLCSKLPVDKELAVSDVSESDGAPFSLANFSLQTNVIQVSVADLMNVYSAQPVYVSGILLNACAFANGVMAEDSARALGNNIHVLRALAQNTNLISSRITLVHSLQEMHRCVERNFPAVGYSPEPYDSESVGLCF
jgi:hypothetical protein